MMCAKSLRRHLEFFSSHSKYKQPPSCLLCSWGNKTQALGWGFANLLLMDPPLHQLCDLELISQSLWASWSQGWNGAPRFPHWAVTASKWDVYQMSGAVLSTYQICLPFLHLECVCLCVCTHTHMLCVCVCAYMVCLWAASSADTSGHIRWYNGGHLQVSIYIKTKSSWRIQMKKQEPGLMSSTQ